MLPAVQYTRIPQPWCEYNCRLSVNLAFSTLIPHSRHLAEPIHGLEVTESAISSFDIRSKVPFGAKAGLCRNCWKIFRTAAELLAHLRWPCNTATLSSTEKEDILYDAFVEPSTDVKNAVRDGAGKSTERAPMSNTVETSMETQTPPPAYFPSDRLGLEENFLRNFVCCGKTWPNLHDLLQHHEVEHPRGMDPSKQDSGFQLSLPHLTMDPISTTPVMPSREKSPFRYGSPLARSRTATCRPLRRLRLCVPVRTHGAKNNHS